MKITFRAITFAALFAAIGLFTSCNTEANKTAENEATSASPETPSTETEVVKSTNKVLNPNLASKEDLLKAPHMTEAIVEAMESQRPFLGMGALNPFLESQGLSEAQRKELYVKLFSPINLNNADRETIMMVPGMGEKMAHEFEEYRPYKNIEQFRREIGKYVDKEEVARFEQYVFVPVELNTASEEQILSIPGLGKKMLHEFLEYRPYKNMEQFNREIGKYVDEKELARLRYYVYIGE